MTTKPPPQLHDYDVRWVIDITATGPADAAEQARHIQRDPRSIAGVFIITEHREHAAQWRIDLDHPQDSDLLRTRETARLIAGTGLDTATGPGDQDAPARLRALQAASRTVARGEDIMSNPRERELNTSAAFLPERDNDDELPVVRIAGCLVSACVEDGTLHVSVNLDDAADCELWPREAEEIITDPATGGPAPYDPGVDVRVPLRITVQGNTVYQAS